ncbi:formylglycine-generating enzyme family protein [Saccharopolyspora sp. NPDC000359]|uniref:formylglycine-generating enzyme family protein n=1 Tax=Saccharopolyspora sp. NPDC000359 TaxID=3154251 RepID=UPI0033193A9F
MIEVPAGRVTLRDEGARTSWEVDVAAFQLAEHPVTRELHLGAAQPGSPGRPVTEVSWLDAIRFCNRLSREHGLDPCYAIPEDRDGVGVVCDWSADGYRLPSEAEWEHACRAGSSEVRYGELDEIAWYRGNSGERVREVGAKEPNSWGLHDMIGNVWEWCWDLYDPARYGPYRVFRGGGAFDPPRGCRASCRRRSHPTFRVDDLGFRLARRGP